MRRDLLVIRVGFAAAGVADDRLDDPFRLIVGRLHAPKTSAGEDCGLGRGWRRLSRAENVCRREDGERENQH